MESVSLPSQKFAQSPCRIIYIRRLKDTKMVVSSSMRFILTFMRIRQLIQNLHGKGAGTDIS